MDKYIKRNSFFKTNPPKNNRRINKNTLRKMKNLSLCY